MGRSGCMGRMSAQGVPGRAVNHTKPRRAAHTAGCLDGTVAEQLQGHALQATKWSRI